MAYVMATIAPERTRGIVTIAIPHPSQLERTPASLFAARHFLALKLPWASAGRQAQRLRLPGELYSRWAPNWSGPERDACVTHVKQALSLPQTLEGAIDYYRALPLGGSRLLDVPPDVPNLAVGGTADIVDADAFRATRRAVPGSEQGGDRRPRRALAAPRGRRARAARDRLLRRRALSAVHAAVATPSPRASLAGRAHRARAAACMLRLGR